MIQVKPRPGVVEVEFDAEGADELVKWIEAAKAATSFTATMSTTGSGPWLRLTRVKEPPR